MAALKGTCLVTGSTGRVGKEVIARLSKAEGFTVRAATRTGADYAKSLVRPLKAYFIIIVRVQAFSPFFSKVSTLCKERRHLECQRWRRVSGRAFAAVCVCRRVQLLGHSDDTILFYFACDLILLTTLF